MACILSSYYSSVLYINYSAMCHIMPFNLLPYSDGICSRTIYLVLLHTDVPGKYLAGLGNKQG